MTLTDKHPSSGTAGWTIKLRDNGDLWFRIGSNANNSIVTATGVYSAGTSVHVACTFSQGTGKIYVNGQLVKTTTGITQTVNDTATNLRLGIPSVVYSNEKFDGILKDVKIYDVALSDSEISYLYSVSVP